MVLIILLLIVLLSIIDSSISTFFFLCTIYVFGAAFLCTIHRNERKEGLKLFNIVFGIYVVLAFVASLSFTESTHFFVSDSSDYIETYISGTEWLFDKEDFIQCYFGFSDSNALYNAYLNLMAMLSYYFLDGMTVYGMTLLQTGWGILSAVVLFRILIRHFETEKAYQYTLVFALSSLFLLYSIVIIRDIIICFLYLCAFDVIDQKFTLKGILKLVILVFLTWGIRLYSGLFLASFLVYYIYIRFRNSRIRVLAMCSFAIVLLVIIGALMSSSIMNQTNEELQLYQELSMERSAGGVLSKLRSLPFGIRHIVILLYAMIRPLPPLGVYVGIETFSHFVISTLFLIAGFFWFVVFYSLCYKLFAKKYIYQISTEEIVLLGLCVLFMFANTSHLDLRRMLPVYPIIYTQYVKLCQKENVRIFGSKESKFLIFFYFVLAIGLLVLM